MNDRTALLIRCSHTEATIIRNEAKLERRTVNNYVLNIVLRSLQIDERVSLGGRDRSVYFTPMSVPGPRSAILVRCSIAEARGIRAAAKQRKTGISSYVLHTLRRTWDVKKHLILFAAHSRALLEYKEART